MSDLLWEFAGYRLEAERTHESLLQMERKGARENRQRARKRWRVVEAILIQVVAVLVAAISTKVGMS